MSKMSAKAPFLIQQPGKHGAEEGGEVALSAGCGPIHLQERVKHKIPLIYYYTSIVILGTLWLYLRVQSNSLVGLQVHETTVINTQANVTYIGKVSCGVESFLNIRYGEPTGSRNRFLAPKLYKYPPNTQASARLPGAACPQHRVPLAGFPILDNVTTISEDCLTLRIDRPAGICSDERLPVLVWIYGGGNSIGQIYDKAYDPQRLIRGAHEKSMPVVYVAMNYRLGIFGFSAFEGFDSHLNAGLLDQRLALEWIQANIEHFGGDPRRVTIFGESAGGIAVGLHVTAYGQRENSSRLFQRAIMQSGGPTSHFGTVATSNYRHTSAISQRLDCSTSVSEFECLQSWPLNMLLSVSLEYSLTINPFGGIGVWGPISPSPFIPAAPSQLLQSGNFSRDTDILIGWNEDDGSLFTAPPKLFAKSLYLPEWVRTKCRTSNSSLVDEILCLYPSSNFKNKQLLHPDIPLDWFRASQIIRDMSYVCPALLLIQASYEHNPSRHESVSQKTMGPRRYSYELNSTLYESFLAERNASFAGVIHFSDIPFVFNQASKSIYNATKEQLSLANLLSGSWAAFAQNGSVVSTNASASLQNWPEAIPNSATAQGFTVRIFGGENDGLVQIGTAPGDFENLEERCTFWNIKDVLDMVGV